MAAEEARGGIPGFMTPVTVEFGPRPRAGVHPPQMPAIATERPRRRWSSHLVEEAVGRGVAGLFPFGEAISGSAIAEIDVDRLGRPPFDRHDLPRCARERTIGQFRDQRFVRSDDRRLTAPLAEARHAHQRTVRTRHPLVDQAPTQTAICSIAWDSS